MSIRVLSHKKLAPFLDRHMQAGFSARDLRLEEFLRLALEKANEFVPSEGGAIFLDDPASKTTRFRERNQLAAVACFGPKCNVMLGKKNSAQKGVVGRVYLTGDPYFSRDVKKDKLFSDEFDPHTEHPTRSFLCVPISIRQSVVGVLRLINKIGPRPYNRKDFELLEIFADYISASIQNFLDAKRHATLAKRDALTELANDRTLHVVLKREATRAWRLKSELSVIFMDLDRFKEVNDEQGHLAGSQVLVEVAQVLRETVSHAQAELARYGGDEYVVVLPDTSVGEAALVAENIRRAIERKVFLSKPSSDVPALSIADQVTASLGVAGLLIHVRANDRNALLKAADEAMYAAKRAGRNRVVVASVERASRLTT